MAQSNQRLAVDLDEIERQLRQSQAPAEAPRPDPLAELARIVGQDDPFRAATPGDRSRVAAGTRAPGTLVARAATQPRYSHDPSDLPEDLFPEATAHGPYVQPDEFIDLNGDELRPLDKPKSRKGLITVGVILGTAALGVGGALLWRSGPKMTTSSEPPIVRADREPLKVQPENPGGVEIPNQDAQVYDRTAKDSQTRVVNREEQPVDVQQAARAVQGSPVAARPIPPGAATPGAPLATTAPQLAPNPATAGLGEPRRVRTVSVKPDGTIVAPEQPAAPAPSGARAASAPAPVASAAPAQAAATTPSTTPQPAPGPPPKPRVEARSAPAPVAPTASDESAAVQISPGLARPAQPPQRTAAVAPPKTAPDPVETTNAAGGFAVQIGVMPTEQEARTQFEQLRRKFASELGARPPMIRAAEVNGKTIYRVRVGPMSQADASALCTKLKAAGGSCFIARN